MGIQSGGNSMKNPSSEKQRLAWIINFINQDIESLGDGDFLKLVMEIGENIESLRRISLTHFLDQAKRETKGYRIDLSNGTRREISPILPPPPDLRSQVKEEQRRLKIFLERILEAKGSSSDITLFSYDIAEKIEVLKDKIGIVRTVPEKPTEFELAELIYECSPEKEKHGRWASLNYIKRCQAPRGRKGEKCLNFFLQLHKTEKNYCSTKCAWRAYSAARRQEEKRPKTRRSR
jgi:hypothetical protein